ENNVVVTLETPVENIVVLIGAARRCGESDPGAAHVEIEFRREGDGNSEYGRGEIVQVDRHGPWRIAHLGGMNIGVVEDEPRSVVVAERIGFVGVVRPRAVGMHADAALARVVVFAVLPGIEFDDHAVGQTAVPKIAAASVKSSRTAVLDSEDKAVGA